MTSHYLNQYWPHSLTHICGTRGRWVNQPTRTQQDEETPWNTSASHYWSLGWWSYTVYGEETCEKHFHATGPLCGESIWCMLPSQVEHTTSRWNPMGNCSTLLCVEATCEVRWKLIYIIALLIEKYLCVEICYINGLVQDWNISIANALEILKSCFKQSIYSQYIAVTYSTILYNTEGGKLYLCSDNKLTKDTPYLTRNEFSGEKEWYWVHCVGEKYIEI